MTMPPSPRTSMPAPMADAEVLILMPAPGCWKYLWIDPARRNRFQRLRQRAVNGFEPLESRQPIDAVTFDGVDFDHDDAGFESGSNPNAGKRPSAEIAADLVKIGRRAPRAAVAMLR